MLNVVTREIGTQPLPRLGELRPGDVFCFPRVDGKPNILEPHLRLDGKFVRLFGGFELKALDNRYASYGVYKLDASLEVSL